jgi:hypothetical protein
MACRHQPKRPAAWLFLAAAFLVAHAAWAQDFSDPADILTFRQKQKANHATLPEVAAAIESTSSAKPGWYALHLKLDNGNALNMIVVPVTRFFQDYAPIAAADAHPLLVKGARIRALHDLEQDLLLRNIIVTDLMFSSPPVELTGVIQAATSERPGVYDLTAILDHGETHHLYLDEKTKFWKAYKPLESAQAYGC